MDEIKIQLRFKSQTQFGEFNDAIYFTETEWANRVPSNIESQKNLRVSNWVNSVKNPPPIIPPTKAQLQLQADDLEKQLTDLKLKIQVM